MYNNINSKLYLSNKTKKYFPTLNELFIIHLIKFFKIINLLNWVRLMIPQEQK